MNRKSLVLLSFSLFTLAVLLIGCKKKISKIANTGWNPNIAVPIGEATFEMSDLIVNIDSTFEVNSLGEISINYEENLDSVLASDFFTLDDYTENFDLTPPGLVPVPIFPNGEEFTNSTTISTSYSAPAGTEINTLNFNSGNLVLTLTSTFQHDATFSVTLPDLIKNGSPITRTINLNYLGSPTTTQSISIDLTDVAADFTAGGTLANSIRASIDATITSTGTPGNPIVGNEELHLDLSLNNLEYKNITGYFGQEVLTSATDSLLLKIFQSANNQGSLSFSNPTLTFNIENSFGVPININLGTFYSIDSITGQSHSLVISPSAINVNTPANMGQSASTSIVMNKNNTTNIDKIFNVNPRYLAYNLSATTNPAGNTGNLNFIESTSMMKIRANLHLPFEGSASGISASDTLEYSLDNDIDLLESVMLRLDVNNGFPVSFNAQITFVDENYNTVFTLFDTPTRVINGALVNNATGKVTSSVQKVTDVKLSSEKVNLLRQVKHIIVNGIVSTTDPQNTNVKLYDSYNIAIKLGIQVTLKN